ncbi:MAG: DUF3298 domain-containing protein [Paraclostridium sp.]
MKSNKKIILISIIGIFFISMVYIFSKSNNEFIINSKTFIFNGIRSVQVTEDKLNIEDKDIKMVVSMPVIHYKDKNVERYINTYIRKNINQFVNIQKQTNDISKKNKRVSVNLNYHVEFEDKQTLNIIIYKDINDSNKKYERIKDSYVFDLNTGQRIYLDNFLKNNEDYDEKIKKYIYEKIDLENRKIDKNKILIDKYTNYYITGEGIGIYFNPYQTNSNKETYDFKIPYDIFEKKVKKLDTSPIMAQIDTQTITKNKKYINSIINIPLVMTENKSIERRINNKIKQDIMNSYYSIEEEAKKYYEDSPLEEITPYIYNVNFEVKKNGDNMLSIVVTYYQESGGAHGFYENESYNIYMKNGENLELENLFKDDKDYKLIIEDNIREQIKEKSKNENNLEIYDFKGIKKEQKFYIQDDKIVIYFDLYEIAPYVAGIPEFPISISKIGHAVNSEYISIFK